MTTTILTGKKARSTYRMEPESHKMLKALARLKRKTLTSCAADLINEATKGIEPDMDNLLTKFPTIYEKRKLASNLREVSLDFEPKTKALLIELAHLEEKQLDSCLEDLILKATKNIAPCKKLIGGRA